MKHELKGLLPINIQLFAGDPNSEENLDLSLDDLFEDPDDSQSSDDNDQTTPPNNDLTKNMSNRINEVKSKTERDTLERVAKDLGYDNYAAMQKAKESDLIKKHGYNPDEIESMIEPLIQKRLADDPRLKKLEALEQQEREIYVQSQLKAINEATGQQLTAADLPQATLDLWAKGIELKQAYYATHGETLITKGNIQQQNGSMTHLASGASTGGAKVRRLTDSEKDMYRSIVPGITEEELNKKTTPIKGK